MMEAYRPRGRGLHAHRALALPINSKNKGFTSVGDLRRARVDAHEKLLDRGGILHILLVVRSAV